MEPISIRNTSTRIGPQTKGRASQERDRDTQPPKSRASLGFIPSPESLATLIGSAVAALRKGVYWDRGSILNLLA